MGEEGESGSVGRCAVGEAGEEGSVSLVSMTSLCSLMISFSFRTCASVTGSSEVLHQLQREKSTKKFHPILPHACNTQFWRLLFLRQTLHERSLVGVRDVAKGEKSLCEVADSVWEGLVAIAS